MKLSHILEARYAFPKYVDMAMRLYQSLIDQESPGEYADNISRGLFANKGFPVEEWDLARSQLTAKYGEPETWQNETILRWRDDNISIGMYNHRTTAGVEVRLD